MSSSAQRADAPTPGVQGSVVPGRGVQIPMEPQESKSDAPGPQTVEPPALDAQVANLPPPDPRSPDLTPQDSEPARKRRPLPAHLRRHTRFVAAMRLVLPAIAALLLGMLALWSRFGLDGDRFMLSLGTLGPAHIDSMSMDNPHFEGLDEKKRPFSVTAKQANQVDKNADVIDLTKPQADMTMENGTWLSIDSDSGRYRRQDQQLDLTGVVNLFQDQGYEMHTRNLHIDLASGKATGREAVQGQGPAGNLTAEGIEVSDGGKRVMLFGRSHMVLNPGEQTSEAVPLP